MTVVKWCMQLKKTSEHNASNFSYVFLLTFCRFIFLKFFSQFFFASFSLSLHLSCFCFCFCFNSADAVSLQSLPFLSNFDFPAQIFVVVKFFARRWCCKRSFEIRKLKRNNRCFLSSVAISIKFVIYYLGSGEIKAPLKFSLIISHNVFFFFQSFLHPFLVRLIFFRSQS